MPEQLTIGPYTKSEKDALKEYELALASLEPEQYLLDILKSRLKEPPERLSPREWGETAIGFSPMGVAAVTREEMGKLLATFMKMKKKPDVAAESWAQFQEKLKKWNKHPEPVAAIPDEPIEFAGPDMETAPAALFFKDAPKGERYYIRTDKGELLKNPLTRDGLFESPEEAWKQYFEQINLRAKLKILFKGE